MSLSSIVLLMIPDLSNNDDHYSRNLKINLEPRSYSTPRDNEEEIGMTLPSSSVDSDPDEVIIVREFNTLSLYGEDSFTTPKIVTLQDNTITATGMIPDFPTLNLYNNDATRATKLKPKVRTKITSVRLQQNAIEDEKVSLSPACMEDLFVEHG